MINYQAGTMHPTEYDWKKQFGSLDILKDGVIQELDVGKVLGLAIYAEELENKIKQLEEEIIIEASLRETYKQLIIGLAKGKPE